MIGLDVEETGDLTHETLIHIVDKSIEEAGAQFQGYHIIISQDGRYQHTISLAQQELLTRGSIHMVMTKLSYFSRLR